MSKATTPLRPARLDIVDMPRDPQRSLGGLRQALCASFNYCRKYPAKLELLKKVLVYVHNRIIALEKEIEAAAKAEKEAVEKAEADAE